VLEESIVYPLLRKFVDGGDDLADLADQEHSAIKTLVERIEIAPPEDLSDVVREMDSLVTKHVEFEEQSVFPEMREAGIDAEDLGSRLEQARDQAA
jgi:hemerythrin superfamily protein